MKLIFRMVALFLIIILTSCMVKHNYIWEEYPISEERISADVSFSEGKELNIIKGATNDSTIFLGNVSKHHYFGSQQSLTDGLVDQLASELKSRGLIVTNSATKSVEVAVQKTSFERGMWKIAVTLDFTVKLGNGKSKAYEIRNSSPHTVDHTYNGAVALAVIKLINDPAFLKYINE